MEQKERAERDVEKLKRLVEEFVETGLDRKYKEAYGWAKNYLKDAEHFLANGDYFSCFGAANYAYGIIDGLLITERRK